ncbi:MAG TPA: FAD-binding protein [Candidatus Binatia bacterium]|nr:FAD-binding protein [Candidatus Binatia bacterium]
MRAPAPAEPGVTFAELVAAAMPYGLAPIVVPELPTITIGGAVSGCSLESTSFRWGGFHDTCLEYEVITARGDVLRCTPDNEHALVFQNDWLKVDYQNTARRREDYRRTPDDFFRYDNGVTNVHPKSALGRLLLGRFLHSTQMLRLAEKLHRWLPAQRPHVIVDLFVPLSRFADFMAWYERAIRHLPLWCVPYRRVRDYEWIAPAFFAGLDDELFVDLAVYGSKQPAGRNVYKELEDALLRLNGIKTLISYNYYDEDVFWTIWNRPNYLAVKQFTDPDSVFRDLWSKTCRAARGLDG